jgi:hypothetical protein
MQMLTLAKQGDGLLLSMFPWVSSDDRKLRMGPMWDFNNGAYGGPTTGTLYFRPERLWYRRLFDDPDFQREYEDRWFDLREGPLSNANMVAIIDAQVSEITTGLADNQNGLNLLFARWQRAHRFANHLRRPAQSHPHYYDLSPRPYQRRQLVCNPKGKFHRRNTGQRS